MLTIENALLVDICLGLPLGKIWHPAELPELRHEDVPATIVLDGRQLAAARHLMERGDASVLRAARGLRAQADQLLALSSLSVIHKTPAPPLGTPKDYYSLSKYWWPDPGTPDGQPYVRRDGELNPEWESPAYDARRLETFTNACVLLSLTAFLTRQPTYASKAVSLIRAWLVDPTTAQTPHFRYAAVTPGRDRSRLVGLVEARRLIYVCESLQLLSHLGALGVQDLTSCRAWYSELLAWFETSLTGASGRGVDNNIGFWIDLQRIVYARFCGRTEHAERVVRQCVLPKIDDQIGADGRLARELSRARPEDYVAFTLLAMAELNAASRDGEIQIAEYSSREGRSFQNAFEWFSRSMEANQLQESALALHKILDLKRRLLEFAPSQFPESDPDSIANRMPTGEVSGSHKFGRAEKDELHSFRGTLLEAGLQMRGMALVIRSQAELLQATESGVLDQAREIQALRSELADERKRHEVLQQETTRLAALHKKAVDERSELRGLYEQVLQSRSWRFTAALRRLEASVQSARQRLKARARPQLDLRSEVRAWATKIYRGLRRRIPKAAAKMDINREVGRIKHRLYSLGFVERGVADLHRLMLQAPNDYQKRLSAWELSLWFANQNDAPNAANCLQMLPAAKATERSPGQLQRIAILEAECLRRLGELVAARQVIGAALARRPNADLLLAGANAAESLPERVEWINKALRLYKIAPIESTAASNNSAYDGLRQSGAGAPNRMGGRIPLVSVIVPVYNAASSLPIALDALLAQTWTALEILVVDDHSSDSTPAVIKSYLARDARIWLLRSDSNQGSYVARNQALLAATGDFVTCHDSDDWSHPQKIETQVRHLLRNPNVVANTSEQARATTDLIFHRRGNPGFYIFANMSSLMFRRQKVIERVGYWDSVRFAGDGEFKLRLKRAFGERAVVDLRTGPLSFQRQSEDTLTGSRAFGYHGFKMGARLEYDGAHEHYRSSGASLRYDFPQTRRPFPVPEPLWPQRATRSADGRRHFDVIIASELRLSGGTSMSNVEEIKAHKRAGMRTGLIQISRYDKVDSLGSVNPGIRALLDGDQVQMLVYGEHVSCDVLIVRHPPILQDYQQHIPDVRAGNVRVVINQTPISEYGPSGDRLYEFGRCVEHLKRYFHQAGVWHPIGPLVRRALGEQHARELAQIALSSEDWVNIIDLDEWRRPLHLRCSSKIRIGRHSRDRQAKWPADSIQLLAIYPDSDKYEIQILGGAAIPQRVLGRLPRNWRVWQFGEIDPRDFLAGLDIFVYYPHPHLIESFGRAIMEAMAVGVPVILPPQFREVFNLAAVYSAPGDVQGHIEFLMSDRRAYEAQVERGWDFIAKNCGYALHIARLERARHSAPA